MERNRREKEERDCVGKTVDKIRRIPEVGRKKTGGKWKQIESIKNKF